MKLVMYTMSLSVELLIAALSVATLFYAPPEISSVVFLFALATVLAISGAVLGGTWLVWPELVVKFRKLRYALGMTQMPTTEEFLMQTIRDENQFIPSRFPYTYATDFVRSNPLVIPDAVEDEFPYLHRAHMQRSDASAFISQWAAMEDWDSKELFNRLALAYCEYNHIAVPQTFLATL